jgi:hypothetical protein
MRSIGELKLMLKSKWLSISLVLKLLLCDIVAGLFLAWLVVDDPRRTPFLVIAIPVLVLVNALIVFIKARIPTSITLLVVYSFGLLYGVMWTAMRFEWWKLLLLIVPAVLLYITIQRFRGDGTSKPMG